MTEKLLKEKFLKLLNSKGYFEENIITEPTINLQKKHLRPDLLLYNTKRERYIGIIEFVNKIDDSNKLKKLHQINSYKEALGYVILPYFFVSQTDDDAFNILYYDDDNGWVEFKKNDFPEIKALTTGIFSYIEKLRNQEKNKVLDNFRYLCWIASGVSFILFILYLLFCDKLKCDSELKNGLILYGISIGLIILPFFSKIKFGDFEIERKENDK